MHELHSGRVGVQKDSAGASGVTCVSFPRTNIASGIGIMIGLPLAQWFG